MKLSVNRDIHPSVMCCNSKQELQHIRDVILLGVVAHHGWMRKEKKDANRSTARCFWMILRRSFSGHLTLMILWRKCASKFGTGHAGNFAVDSRLIDIDERIDALRWRFGNPVESP